MARRGRGGGGGEGKSDGILILILRIRKGWEPSRERRFEVLGSDLRLLLPSLAGSGRGRGG